MKGPWQQAQAERVTWSQVPHQEHGRESPREQERVGFRKEEKRGQHQEAVQVQVGARKQELE